MPGAPFTVADPQGLRGAAGAGPIAGTAPASATRRFARRAEEVPMARRFIRDELADHPSSLDAELLACELVTNAVQHATDAAGVTVAVTRRGAAHRSPGFLVGTPPPSLPPLKPRHAMAQCAGRGDGLPAVDGGGRAAALRGLPGAQ